MRATSRAVLLGASGLVVACAGETSAPATPVAPTASPTDAAVRAAADGSAAPDAAASAPDGPRPGDSAVAALADARGPIDLRPGPMPNGTGTSPVGEYRATAVAGAPRMQASQVTWWNDRLIIADHSNGGQLVQYIPPSTFQAWVKVPSPFGVTAAADGTLLVASKTPGKRETSKILRVRSDGAVETLLEGAPAIYPQQIVAHRSGRIYWTNFDDATVRSMKPGEEPTSLKPSVGHSYGIAVSPQQDYLYVSSKFPDASARSVYRYPLNADGTTREAGAKLFTVRDLTAPAGDVLTPYVGRLQGITTDALGNIYVGGAEQGTTSPAVAAIAPDGKSVLAVIRLPGPDITDCAFGGPDLRTLFITRARILYEVRLPVTGTVQ